MKPRVIVCGLGRTGYRILSLLKKQGADAIGLSARPIENENNLEIIIGDPRSPTILVEAGIKSAEVLVLASNDDALNLAVLTRARSLNPRVRVINRQFNQTLGEKLDLTLPDHVSMSVASIASPIFAFAALGNRAIGQLNLYNEIWPIQETIVDGDHPWLNLPLRDLWDDPTRMLIYYLPAREEIDLVSAVVLNKRLQAGDHLIIGTKPRRKTPNRSILKKILAPFSNLQPYQRYVGSVLAVMAALLFLIGSATVTYISVNHQTSLIDSLYFSVGMITGAGGNEKVVDNVPDGIKIFTILMMLIGAAVIGICYALLNDFVLGSRFKDFWDATKIPDREHHIVCGLGTVGLGIIRQLHGQGQEIVVIEPNPRNRFLHTVRSLGIPVLVEDGRLTTTLEAARIKTAASLIIATNEDMVNVEIGLTAKALAPKINLVSRSSEEQFGRSIQEVFDFDAVLCPAELATYSFTAAALGGKILGSGMTEDLLWVALAILITPNHPFRDRKVKEVAIESDLVPLYLEKQGYTLHGWQLLETTLQEGSLLYLTIPATNLSSLWRTEARKN